MKVAADSGMRERIELFLLHEARLLDQRRFEEWMELFTEDGYYWAPARPDQPAPLAGNKGQKDGGAG